jgi:hypothetical protein
MGDAPDERTFGIHWTLAISVVAELSDNDALQNVSMLQASKECISAPGK